MSERYSQGAQSHLGSNIVLKLKRGEIGAKMSIFAKIGSGYEPGETPVILIKK